MFLTISYCSWRCDNVPLYVTILSPLCTWVVIYSRWCSRFYATVCVHTGNSERTAPGRVGLANVPEPTTVHENTDYCRGRRLYLQLDIVSTHTHAHTHPHTRTFSAPATNTSENQTTPCKQTGYWGNSDVTEQWRLPDQCTVTIYVYVQWGR